MKMEMEPARYTEPFEGGGVRCLLCPHRCIIREGQSGLCGVRTCNEGTARATGFGQVSATHTDPIEKKPLYHFFPGSSVFSIGGWGCNLRCRFCQNWEISQQTVFNPANAWKPKSVAKAALDAGAIGVAYTYNEPLIGIEFVEACARATRGFGLKNILVTNGYINPGPADGLLPWIDAVNLDIKAMDDPFYRHYCGGELEPVLAFARQVRDAGVHLELTHLLIPGANDGTGRAGTLAGWIAANLGDRIPLHITAYRPAYRMRLPPTDATDLESACTEAREHLAFVYTGNLDIPGGSDTRCPRCRNLLVARKGYSVMVKGLTGDGACSACGERCIQRD